MGTNNVVFLEVIEWFDESGKELVHRIPEEGSGEIKWGAQMTVRESQAAVFFYNGKAFDAFGPGRHTLKTANIPLLTKVLSIPWGMTSPLRAEVYFVNMKVFPNLTWGTRDPVAFRDKELGLIRLQGLRYLQPPDPPADPLHQQPRRDAGGHHHGRDRRVSQPGHRRAFQRLHGERIETIFDLPAKYDEFAGDLKKILQDDFTNSGWALTDLYINSITPPPEVQKAIDDKSRLGVFDDVNKLLKMKAAMALETAAQSQGETGASLGMGMGFMMPGMIAEALRSGTAPRRRRKRPPVPPVGNRWARVRNSAPTAAGNSLPLRPAPDAGKPFPQCKVLRSVRPPRRAETRGQEMPPLQGGESTRLDLLQPVRTADVITPAEGRNKRDKKRG